jgi:hypothetical protein
MPTILEFDSHNHLKGILESKERGISFAIETATSKWGSRKLTTIASIGDDMKAPVGEINWDNHTFSIGDHTRDWKDLKLDTAGIKR